MEENNSSDGSKKLPAHNPHLGTLHHGPGFLYPSLIGLPIAFRNNQSPHLPYILHAPPQNTLLFSSMLRHCMFMPPRHPREEEWVLVEEEPRVEKD